MDISTNLKCQTERIKEHSKRIKYDGLLLRNIGGLMNAQGNKPNDIVLKRISQLQIQRNKRGKRGGRCHNYTRKWDYNQGINENNLRTLPQVITTVVKNDRCSNSKPNTLNYNNIVEIKPQSNQKANKYNKLKICSIYSKSVKNKTIAICDFILSNDFDLVAICETWLSNTVGKNLQQ